MTILKFEIDTQEIGFDVEGYGRSFEDGFHSAIKTQITKRVIGNITKEEIGQYSILVQEEVSHGVDTLFKNLLNEDVVITDGYGSKKFVGCVEDYIKKEIDERYLFPVGSDGKKLSGCTSSSKTWVQWYLEREAKQYIDSAVKDSAYSIRQTIKKTIEKELKQYIDKTISDQVSENLKNVGIRV